MSTAALNDGFTTGGISLNSHGVTDVFDWSAFRSEVDVRDSIRHDGALHDGWGPKAPS
jgi:hypothetical protein